MCQASSIASGMLTASFILRTATAFICWFPAVPLEYNSNISFRLQTLYITRQSYSSKRSGGSLGQTQEILCGKLPGHTSDEQGKAWLHHSRDVFCWWSAPISYMEQTLLIYWNTSIHLPIFVLNLQKWNCFVTVVHHLFMHCFVFIKS